MERWQAIDTARESEARQLLHVCCGSPRWIDRMMARRPFGTREAAQDAARELWFTLDRSDWIEAFSHHPRIGDREALRRKFASTRTLSEREQSGVTGATQEVLTGLIEGNQAY
jgi:2-oxo-4-hydroxy-4-carboxy-5-ureidoimidazoline decarboxylase